MSVRFSGLDWGMLGVMMVVSLGIGVYSRLKGGGSSTQRYLLGGTTMNPGAVTLSLLGGFLSAVSLLGTPAEMYYYGTQLCTCLFGCVLGCIFVTNITLPIFYKLKILSINEYLERRYGSRLLRQLTSGMLASAMFLFLGIYLYVPSLALTILTNMSTHTSILVIAAVVTFYITIGGIKAVVYTDVFQTLVMFGGLLIIVVVCCSELGGIQHVWEIADKGQRLEFFNIDPSPYVRHTFWTTTVFGIYSLVNFVGLNQPMHQRFLSVATLPTAQRLCWGFLAGLWAVSILQYLAGLAAYATYSECDPLAAGFITKPDQILIYLVSDKLSLLPGLAGLFVAVVYGAILSSLSSYQNAIVSIIWEDFLKARPYFAGLSEGGATNVMKCLSILTGLLSICPALMMENLGNIFQVANGIWGAMSGPITGMYLAGILIPWANSKGAVSGFVVSFSYCVSVVIGNYVLGGGVPATLPLSLDGCYNNTTTNNTNINTTNIITFVNATHSINLDTVSPTYVTQSDSDPAFYDLSYCYIGMVGTLITFAVTAIVSLVTGPSSPSDVSEGLVNPTCRQLYLRAWQTWGQQLNPLTHSRNAHTTNTTTNSIIQDKEVDVVKDADPTVSFRMAMYTPFD